MPKSPSLGMEQWSWDRADGALTRVEQDASEGRRAEAGEYYCQMDNTAAP